MIYTLDLHIKYVQEVIKEPDPYHHCPATTYYVEHHNEVEIVAEELKLYKTFIEPACVICNNFISKVPIYNYSSCECPCSRYGTDKAIELTQDALKRGGHI